MSNPNNILVAYSQNDFFYNAVNYTDSDYNNMCGNLLANEATYNCKSDETWASYDSALTDKQTNCVNLELCRNRDTAGFLKNIKSVHSGAEERLSNTQASYNKSMIMTVNLAIGVVGIGYVISVLAKK
jgi:hypothetical protein